MKRHTISVIIPTIGRESLDQCLQAIHRQTIQPDEVIVARDEERRGASLTRNQGIAKSSGELLAFTDDDCVPSDYWLEELVRVMHQYDADVVGGTLQESDSFLRSIHKRRAFPAETQEDLSGRVGNTANILYKRSILDECFKQYGYVFKGLGEDIDLIWRIRQLQAKIVYSPVVVTHLRTFRPVPYMRHQFGRGMSIACLYDAYQRTPGKFISQPSLLWGQGKTGRSAHWLKAVWVKVIGPFDVKSFPSVKDFFFFWLGEKAQGLGFLWGLLNRKNHKLG